MNLILNLTKQEVAEIRQRTDAANDAEAVSRAAREYLRTCRSRELTAMAAKLDYDENAWRELDESELGQPLAEIDACEHLDG
jgi:hypothetical protein